MSEIPRVTPGQKKGQIRSFGTGMAEGPARWVPPYLTFPFVFHRPQSHFMAKERRKEKQAGVYMPDYLWKQQILKGEAK